MLIYCITNKINKKRYVGQSQRTNPQLRWDEHLRAVKRNEVAWPIHRAIIKHGIENFEFSVVEANIETLDLLNQREIFWIAQLETFRHKFPDKGYNLTEGGGGALGVKGSTLAKRAAGERRRGKFKHTEASKQKMSKNLLGKTHSDETKLKMSKIRKGRKLSEEHSKAISKGQKGRINTQEHCDNMSKGRLKAIAEGKIVMTDEWRANISKNQMGIIHYNRENCERTIRDIDIIIQRVKNGEKRVVIYREYGVGKNFLQKLFRKHGGPMALEKRTIAAQARAAESAG